MRKISIVFCCFTPSKPDFNFLWYASFLWAFVILLFFRFWPPLHNFFSQVRKNKENYGIKNPQNWHAANIENGIGFENYWNFKSLFFFDSKTIFSFFQKTSFSVFYRGEIQFMPWYILVVLGLRNFWQVFFRKFILHIQSFHLSTSEYS